MQKICVLSGNEEGALCRVLERDFEVTVLIPLCGTSLSAADVVVVTDSAAAHSIGAEGTLRRLLVGAVCRGVPVVFVAERRCLDAEFLRYGQWLLYVDGAWGACESSEAICRRYGLRGVQTFDEGTDASLIYEALSNRCKKILISEDKQNVKTNRA